MKTKGILFIMAALCFGVANSEAIPTFETYFAQDNYFIRIQIVPFNVPDGAVGIKYYTVFVGPFGSDFGDVDNIKSVNYGGEIGFINPIRPGFHDVHIGFLFADGSEQIFDAPDYTIAEPDPNLPRGSVPPEKSFSVPDAGSSAAMLLVGLGALHWLRRSNRANANNGSGC